MRGNWWKCENAKEIDENSAAVREQTQFTNTDSAGEPRSCELHITECGVRCPALTSRPRAPYIYIYIPRLTSDLANEFFG